MSLPLLTSAPGKVIIFGEHSAVFNEPAIAASVSSLRTYLLITDSSDKDAIELDFPDIGFDHKWYGGELASVGEAIISAALSKKNELGEELVKALEGPLSKLKDNLHYHAAFCFLYMYLCLCGTRTGVKFTVKSTSPIGAGLGSSASIAVCLALGMGKLQGHIPEDNKPLSEEALEFVNKWSFIGEKCMHGTPSGIDNAVATYGSAVLFQRSENGDTKFERILDFPQMPMILTDTRIPRSTKVLVSGVRDFVTRQPSVAQPILTSMGHLATKGAEIISKLDDTNYDDLLELVRVNHGLLVALGVSHPGLEVIRSLSDTMGIGATKLTGAGGGGCALTLINKKTPPEEIEKFKRSLEENHKYRTFVTGLGGLGCCYVPATNFAESLDNVINLFHKDSTREELDAMLLPKSGGLEWVY